MRKLQKSILYFLTAMLAIILCLSFKNPVQAEVSYTIPKIAIDAKVQKDGSMKMKTVLTYHFDSSAQGLSYENHLPENQKFKDIKVRVKRNRQKWETFYSKNEITSKFAQRFHKKNSPKYNFSMPDFTHTYLYYDDGSFDVFDPDIKKGDTIKVEYDFVLTNAITNWKDTAELNRKFLGRNTDVEIGQARIALSFAQNPGKKLQLWVHSKAKGKIRKSDRNRKILITADNIEPHTSLEIHAAFPKEVTSLNKNVKNKKHLKYIENQEAEITKRTQQKRIMHLLMYIGLLLIVAIPSILSVRYAFFVKPIGHTVRKYDDLPHSFEIPDLDPIMAQVLYLGNEPTQNGFAGFITQQVAKDRLSLKRLAHDNYEISVVDKEVVRDSSLLRDILVKGGDGKKVTTKQLRDADLGSAYSYWQRTMLGKAERLRLILDRKSRQKIKNRLNLSKLGNWLAVISAISILLFSQVSYKYWLIAALAVLMIINSFSRHKFKKQNGIYTKEGATKAEQVIGFAKMLNDIGNFKKKDLPELPLWEDIMPYAVGLGISKKVLKKLKIYFPSEADVATTVSLSNWYYSGVYDFERGVNDTAYDAETNNFGSSDYTSSDFSSDFTSGDSGGSDGDSGFGAF